jgi:hypothetical protein
MQTFSLVIAGALLNACCVMSASAQTSSQSHDPSAPKTRAEVQADLAEWLAAGYDPRAWWDYPDNALRAGAIVAARRAQAGNVPINQ